MTIKNFACKNTEAFFHGQRVAKFASFEKPAMRRLQQLHAATDLSFLEKPPGNRLEKFKSGEPSEYSVRINNQWRIRFIWENGAAQNVRICDYH